MICNKKTFILIFVILISFVWYIVFSDEVNTRYTEFYFLSGGEYSNNVLVNLTGWETGNVTIYLENKSDSTFNWKFSFVDSDIVQHWSDGIRVCRSENEKDVFGQYVSVDLDSFSIVSDWNISRSLNLLFPAWYSGVYYGCVVYYPNISESDGYLNTSARKAIFLDVDVTSSARVFDVIVRPAFRRTNGDGYSLPQSDFWLFEYQWWVWNEIYNSSKNLSDPKIDIDTDGISSVVFVPPVNGNQYLVAFKWNGAISVGYTGIWDASISSFNFFSGDIADNLSSDYVFKYFAWWFTWNYLRAWDLANDIWTFDLIKDADFTLMTDSLTVSFGALHPDWYDLDRNTKINALEQTMLLDSYNRRWFITTQSYLDVSDFVDL